MSLAIDLDAVTEVLLADGWHHVEDTSFVLDSYEYKWRGELVHGGGEYDVCAMGFEFKSDGTWIAGPLTAVLAVRRYAQEGED